MSGSQESCSRIRTISQPHSLFLLLTDLILRSNPLHQLGKVLFEPLGVALVRFGDLFQKGLLRLVHKNHGGLQKTTNLHTAGVIIYYFYGATDFLKMKLCRARGRFSYSIFWKRTLRNITDRQHYVYFRKSLKVLNLSPLYCTTGGNRMFF